MNYYEPLPIKDSFVIYESVVIGGAVKNTKNPFFVTCVV